MLKLHKLAMLGIGATVAAMALLLGGVLPAGSAQAQEDPGGAMGIAADGSGVDCGGDECIVDPGTDFTLTVSVTEAPTAGYIGLGTQVQYDNLTYSMTEEAEEEIVIDVDNFPGILVRAPDVALENTIDHGMTGGTPPSFTTSMYTGPIVVLSMTCTDEYTQNDVLLAPYAADNTTGSGFKLPISAGGATVPAGSAIVVHCGPPPTATEPPPGEPAATPTLSTSGPPETGTGNGTGSSDVLWMTLGGLLVAVAVASAGSLAWRRTHN